MLSKDVKVPLQEVELVGTSSSNKNKVITNPNLSKFYGRQRDWKKLHPDFARILILVNQPGLSKLSLKMTRLNRLIIYQFFRAVHTESK